MKRLTAGSRVGIVSCSNGLNQEKQEQMKQLEDTLKELGLMPVFSPYLYERKNDVRSGTGRERAEALMAFFRDESIEAVFDVSGGDVAVEVIPYLDFAVIAKSHTLFWGYSDLSTIVNAIYEKTGIPACLYQVRNLVRAGRKQQTGWFRNYLQGGGELFDFSYQFLRGDTMEGVVVGGNTRCLLKLAGTPFWPDMAGKILFLEGFTGKVPQLVSFFNQLKIMGVFEQIQGILLGTFTEMDSEQCSPTAAELILELTQDSLPIAQTEEIGHGADAKCLRIGYRIKL